MKKLMWLLGPLLLVAVYWGHGAGWWVVLPKKPVLHTVVRGDTLGRIARDHGVAVDELRRWNGIVGDLIEVGQVLEVHVEGTVMPVGPSAEPRRARPKRTADAGHQAIPDTLRMPSAKACLAGPSLDGTGGDEPSFAASAGLSQGQIRSAMDSFLPTLGRCFDDGWPSGRVVFDLTVACTGRVAEVRTLDDGGISSTVVACMADTLRYTPFSAHDLPDGMDFRYPMTLSP